jgi:nuclease-like protein
LFKQGLCHAFRNSSNLGLLPAQPFPMDRLFEVLILEGLGVGILLLLGKAYGWWTRFSRSRTPASERFSRLPTFQRTHDELNRFLICSAVVFLFVPGVFICFGPELTNAASIIFFAGLLCLSAYPGFCVLRLRRVCALDLAAELAVAKELRRLETRGCRVFHNLPAHADWSFDHVVIAPSGVYAIETIAERTRSKPDSEVIFDGTHLHFKRYTDSDALGQARRSASELSWELGQATNELIEITPVLAIPGCHITRNGTSEVAVVNTDELDPLILKTSEPQLAPAQIQNLADSLEQQLLSAHPQPVAAAI